MNLTKLKGLIRMEKQIKTIFQVKVKNTTCIQELKYKPL